MRTQSSLPVVGADILRSPELHDFSDLPHVPAVRKRMLVAALAIAALLTVGHMARSGAFNPAESDTPRQTASRV